MQTPNLKTLHFFDCAARHLNFRRAGEELNVTQGAVAQQVRNLEADLGIQLFEREARGLSLTRVGRDYHAAIRPALQSIVEATERLLPQRSNLSLSVTPSFASKWLVPKLAGFEMSNPEVDVKIVASAALANFQSDGIDLAIRQGKPPFGSDLDATLLAQLDVRAVCSADYAKRLGVIGELSDFVGSRLIQDDHALWDILFSQSPVADMPRKTQFNHTALAIEAAANGQGVALVPHLLAISDIAKGRLVEIWAAQLENKSGYYLVTPRDRVKRPSTQAMINWLLAEASASA